MLSDGRAGSEVYATRDHFYVFTRMKESWNGVSFAPDGVATDTTRAFKFDLNRRYGTVTLQASGVFRGHFLNSFSVDEHAGLLRVAASYGWMKGYNLYVLGERGTSLEVVGKVEDLAKGERIYSARFVGDRAYIVTFKKVDPLFAIDYLNDADDGALATRTGRQKWSNLTLRFQNANGEARSRPLVCLDVNGDGAVTPLDVLVIRNRLVLDVPTVDGDRNRDGEARRAFFALEEWANKDDAAEFGVREDKQQEKLATSGVDDLARSQCVAIFGPSIRLESNDWDPVMEVTATSSLLEAIDLLADPRI